jgi:flagellar biosynthesis/type III secretory pathway chaperone
LSVQPAPQSANRPRPRGADGTAARAAAVLSELVQSLHDESDALVAGDVDALAQAVERKSRALRELAPELRSGGSAALRLAVRDAGELNRQNGRMLAARMNVSRGRIEALLGSASTNSLYAANGHAAGGAGPRSASRGVRA